MWGWGYATPFMFRVSAAKLLSRKTFLSWGSRGLSILLQLLMVNFLSSRLGVEGYGRYAFLITVVGFGNLFDLGLSIAVQNRVSQLKARQEDTAQLYSSLMGMTLLLAIILYAVVAGLLAILQYTAVYPDIAGGYPYLLLGLAILFGYSNIFLRTVFSEEHGDYVFHSQTVLYLAHFLVLFALFSWLPNRENLIYTAVSGYYALFSAVNILVCILKGGGRKVLSLQLQPVMIRQLLKLGRGFALFAVIGFFITQLDVTLLGLHREFVDLAIYSVVAKIFFGVCFTFLSVLMSLAHSKVARDWELGKKEELRSRLKSLIIVNLTAVVVFVGGFELFKTSLVKILLPQAHASELQRLWVYLYYAFFVLRVCNDVFVTFFLAMSKTRVINTITVFQAALSAGLQIFLFKRFHLEGLVIALISCYAFSLFVFAIVFTRRTAPKTLTPLHQE